MERNPTPEENHEDVLRIRAKRELRKRMRALRQAVPTSALAARSEAITQNVLTLPAWRGARTVALFHAMADEVNTAALIADARERGCIVVLPVVRDEPILEFRTAFDGTVAFPLVRSAFGIEEPGPEAPLVALSSIELIIVPALAVDPRGHRLGYGRGYYDRTLSQAELRDALRVAIAFDFQLMAELPSRADDETVDLIVTDRQILRATPERTHRPMTLPDRTEASSRSPAIRSSTGDST